jgi:anti-sigma factor RsiW
VTVARCEQLKLAELTDYAAGELPETEAAAIEEHLFVCIDCAARAAELDAIVRAMPSAMRSAEVGGFATDTLLNRLARQGVRMRTYALSPGAVVPCAVWDGDELMALRLRCDPGSAGEITMTQHVAGDEVLRATGQIAAGSSGEVIFTQPAAWVRRLPATEVEVRLSVREGGVERPIGSYTLVHGGSMHRSR